MSGLVNTPRGAGESMRSLSPNEVRVSYGGQPTASAGTGADWFGPLQPMRPVAPAEVAGRAWDFPVGYNLNTTARPYEALNFEVLRALADSFDVVRLIIEARKNQLSRLPWCVRIKHDGSGRRPATAQLSHAMRGRLLELNEFFQRPSYGVNFRMMLRALAEDLLVVDAPALILKRDRRSNLVGLENIDGATLKPVIDDWGRPPQPFSWSGEDFRWNGQLVTPENFAACGFRLHQNVVYPPSWQQILKGLPAVDLTAFDLIYRPMNVRPGHVFGMSPVEQLATTISIATRRTTSQLEYFREGNQPDAIFALPETWSPDQIGRFQEYWDSLFSGNLAARRRMKFVVGDGNSYRALKEPPLKSEFDEWLVRIICFAFSYPPTPFLNLNNRSLAEQHERTAEEEGLEPLKQWAADLFNEIVADQLGEHDFEFAWIEEDEVDQKRQAEILSEYVAAGILTVDEARERIGYAPMCTNAGAN